MNKTEFRHKVFSMAEQLFPMVSRMLGNTVNAEDAIQEIMIKLWVKRHEIEKHPNIKGLVFLTARNCCIDVMRKKNIKMEDAPFQLEIARSENNQEQLEWKELQINVRKILKNLPAQQREVMIMRDLDGYDFEEIAAALDLKIEHVRVLSSRARNYVSMMLDKIYSYERG